LINKLQPFVNARSEFTAIPFQVICQPYKGRVAFYSLSQQLQDLLELRVHGLNFGDLISDAPDNLLLLNMS
jgi:hypothetical protein